MLRSSIRSGFGRGDLLWLTKALSGPLPAEALRALGLREDVPPAEPQPTQRPLPIPRRGDGAGEAGVVEVEKPIPENLPTVRHGERRLSFHRPMECDELAEPNVEVRPRNPVSDAELAVPWARTAPGAPPLVSWSRMAFGLRHHLGMTVDSRRLDLRALEARVGRGLPLTSLPRLSRVQWAAELVVIRDRGMEMEAFQPDIDELLARIRRERGYGGLRVRELRGPPEAFPWRSLPASAPVLVLSAMGQMQRAQARMEAWERCGRGLLAAGRALLVLNPAPRDRWNAELVSVWPTVLWDRAGRFPRNGLGRSGPTIQSDDQAERQKATVERLLTLLSPGVRVEPALLRLARLAIGAEADAGTEHDAWNGPDTWASSTCFGFEHGPALERRLNARGADPLADPVGQWVVEHHRHCSLALVFECELRAALSGSNAAQAKPRLREMLERFVARLQQIAMNPDGSEAVESGVPEWLARMVDRLSESMRADTSIQRLLSQAWAIAFRSNHPGIGKPGHAGEAVVIPPGLDREMVHETMRGLLAKQVARMWRVRVDMGGWVMEPETPDAAGARMRDLARMPVGRPFVSVGIEDSTLIESRHAHGPAFRNRSLTLPTLDSRIEILHGRPKSRVIVETDQQRLTFSPLRRPAWARSMSEDRYGLRATFEVRGVTFALRWIPPGSFWMGSPEDEPGRFPNEGPRHRVTIKQGFWMGETPVTQEQWRAVAEEAGPAGGLKPSPSHFKPRADLPPPEPYSAQGGLPVELVSWDDCMKFTRFLSSLTGTTKVDGLSFRLPTEAEWEHACRAGTDTALYTGAIDLDGTSAKALDDIAWYVHNSGPDVDVENPQDPKVWMGKEFPIDRAGTHRVGMKRPNAWGLHDMLGNVWEWCADGKRDYHDEAETDPPVPAGEGDASRVVRGGSWDSLARWCRSAYRLGGLRDDRWLILGLRLLAGHQSGQEQDQQAGMVGGRAASSPGPRGSGDARGAGPAGGRTGGGSSEAAKRRR